MNTKVNQLSEDRVRQHLHTTRELAVSLKRLPPLPPFSRQGTPALPEHNPRFQQLQQRVQNLTNERETLAQERDELTEEHDAWLPEGEAHEAWYRAMETDLGEGDRATIVTLNTVLTNTNTALTTATTALANAGVTAPPAGKRPRK